MGIREDRDIPAEQKAKLQEQLEQLENTPVITVESAVQLSASFGELLHSGDKNQIRAVLTALIDHIDIDGEDVSIYWNFK